MKIVQLITHMNELGGAQIHVAELSKELKNKGHDVTVIGSGFCELVEELQKEDIKYEQLRWMCVPIRPYQDVRAYFETLKIIRRINPEIIAIHSSKAGIIGRAVARRLKIPVVFTAHSWSFSGETSLLKRNLYINLERLMGRYSDGIIAVSNYDNALALKNKIIPDYKIRTIHNGIPDDKRSFKTKKNQCSVIRLLMVARFATPKNHQLLIRSLKKVTSRNWHVTFVGDGPLFEETKAYAKMLKLEENITFLGEDRNVVERLSESDVFLLISNSEGLPISIIEALREGIPVIASDVGGVNELIENNQQGFLVERENEESLKKAIDRLLTSLELREFFGHSARQRFKEKFIFSSMYDKTENYYTEIIEHRSNSRRDLK